MPTVSNGEADTGTSESGALPEDFARLESSVRLLLDRLAGYQDRAETAEQKSAEMEKTLKDMSSGALDPMQLREGLRRLESENEELRRRMVAAQDRIRRLVARFDFLREEM